MLAKRSTFLRALCLFFAIVISSSILLPLRAQIQLSYYLPSNVTYNPAVPTPESFFGFQVGEWHLQPDQIHAYMHALAEVSDRITIESMGKTHEQRPIILMVITSPENHGSLKAIKEEHLTLSDPARSASLKTDTMPLVVWMGYSVHGNEPSGSNASVLVAYYLAAAQGSEIEKLLKETVILLNPSINPDGLNRFAHWANSFRGKNLIADPNNREHNEVWPGGRTNHYWFDLNRDWMPLQHPESKARLEKYYEWRPNVLTDHHEMGTNRTFFFQPGVLKRENPLMPRTTHELTKKIARYHVEALDKIGSLYYSQEGYDDFYIGKGSSYPDITGGIGILFEQASSRGHLQEGENGKLSFPFTIRNQFTTSLSTLRASQALRKELLGHQREFFASALREAEKATVKVYVFGSSTDPARSYHLLEILRRHQIQVYELARQIHIDGKSFEAGSAYVVPTNQPQFRLITSLFERRTQFEDSLFYDISAWTLPLAFNLAYVELKTMSTDLLGRQVTSPSMPEGEIVGGKGSYAYVFEWNAHYAPRALYRLLRADVRASVATQAFEATTAAGTRKLDYGTIVVPLGSQPERADTIESLIRLAAREDALRVFALQSGSSKSGIDLGSPSMAPLPLPKVMIVVGSGVSATEAGAAWHLLDHRFDIPVSLVETSVFNRADLSRYNVITMVNGTYNGIDSSGRESLRRWVGNGGTLITMKGATEWAVGNRLAVGQFKRTEPWRKDSTVARRAYGDEEKHTRALNIDGAIFEVSYDRTHPLLFGYDDTKMSVFRSNAVFLEPSGNPYATPMVYTQSPLQSGYINKEHEKNIRNSAAVVVSGLRSGRVILMADDPNFRAFWYGTNKLFLNGIFFGSIIKSSTARSSE